MGLYFGVLSYSSLLEAFYSIPAKYAKYAANFPLKHVGISKSSAPIFSLNKSSIRIFKSWIFKLSTLELRCLLAGGGWKGTSGGSRPSKVRFNRSACQGPR